MATRFQKPELGNLIMILTVALAAIFLFVSLTGKTTEGIEFVYPEDASFIVTTFQILIVGAAVVLAYNLSKKISTKMGKVEAFSLVLIIVTCWLVWQFVIVPVFPNLNLDGISFALVKKTGAMALIP
jgi:hypothetical protein